MKKKIKILHITRNLDNIIYGGIQEHIKQFCSLKDERIVNHTASVSHINYQNKDKKP